MTPSEERERPLPRDPDLEVDEGPRGRPIPVHLSPAFIALVALGGTLGTAARHGTEELLGHQHGLPVGTLAVNLIGAFMLGALIELFAVRGSDVGRRRAARLLLGTGFLGGFTTYSALAVETDALLREGSAGLALGYPLATVVVGLVLSLAGIKAVRAVAT